MEMGDGKKLPWERARTQFSDILGVVRGRISPGPPQEPSRETEAQTGQLSSEWLR